MRATGVLLVAGGVAGTFFLGAIALAISVIGGAMVLASSMGLDTAPTP